MIKNNCNKTIDEIKVASKAVIEHLFNNHEYCDSRWCRSKKLIETNKKNEVSESNEERIKNIENTTNKSFLLSKQNKILNFVQSDDSMLPSIHNRRAVEEVTPQIFNPEE